MVCVESSARCINPDPLGNALVSKLALPSSSDWCWERDENGWKLVWLLYTQAQKIFYELIHSTAFSCVEESQQENAKAK